MGAAGRLGFTVRYSAVSWGQGLLSVVEFTIWGCRSTWHLTPGSTLGGFSGVPCLEFQGCAVFGVQGLVLASHENKSCCCCRHRAVLWLGFKV